MVLPVALHLDLKSLRWRVVEAVGLRGKSDAEVGFVHRHCKESTLLRRLPQWRIKIFVFPLVAVAILRHSMLGAGRVVHERVCLLLDPNDRPSFLLNLHLALTSTRVALGLDSKLSLKLFYLFDKVSLRRLNNLN